MEKEAKIHHVAIAAIVAITILIGIFLYLGRTAPPAPSPLGEAITTLAEPRPDPLVGYVSPNRVAFHVKSDAGINKAELFYATSLSGPYTTAVEDGVIGFTSKTDASGTFQRSTGNYQAGFYRARFTDRYGKTAWSPNAIQFIMNKDGTYAAGAILIP